MLIGGSPCTHWSIAQRKNRETKAEGIGWELFLNYVIAKEKWKPDIFLYENNESAADEIKNQISEELGYSLLHINSALVSAQQRKRIYCTNIPNVPQPSDRHIFLKDILEYGIVENENAYLLKHQSGNVVQTDNEPIHIGDIDTTQAHRVYSSDGKSVNITSNGGGQGAKTELYMTPIAITSDSFKHLSEGEMNYMIRDTNGKYSNRWAFLNNSHNDKSVCVVANVAKGVPYNLLAQEVEYIDISQYKNVLIEENGNITIDGKTIYLVVNGEIAYKNGLYPIKLSDGYYIIRKLTIKECERLQTLPDGYTAVPKNSATQRYKQIGNGWTAEVIIHILKQGLKDVPKDYPIEVLSLYDGIATGRYCLEKMGFTNIKYKAYEIDKYAMNVATYNYPDIEECGDVFQIRNDDWKY